MLLVANAVFLAILLVLLGHSKFFRSHKVERGVEVSHCHKEGVNGTTIFQVAYKVYVQIVKGSLCLVYAVEVEHTL